jgi:Glycosyl transferase family 8
MSTTIVTGYWSIPSKHSHLVYEGWFNFTLRVNAPHVIFYEDESVKEKLRVLRDGMPTHFIRHRLLDFHAYGEYRAHWNHSIHVPTTAVGMIWLEKVHMVKEASRMNVFNTSWVAWVDAGNAIYRNQMPPSDTWPHHGVLEQLPRDQIIYTVSETGDENFHTFAGTAFMYHIDFSSEAVNIFREGMKICIELYDDWRCGSDQIVFTLIKNKRSDAFFEIGVGYGTLVPLLYSAEKYAVVTMVSSAEYVEGANVLLYSLTNQINRAIRWRVKFFALTIKTHADNAVVMSKLHGWQVLPVDVIHPPYPGAVSFERFKEQFTKLLVWNMTAFDRILYLDSDTLCVSDPSAMLTQPRQRFAAVKDWENGAIRDHFNMGVFSVRPDTVEFLRLDALRLTLRGYRMEMAEQGFINAVYAGEIEEFPFEYNGNLAAAAQDSKFWRLRYSSLKIIHYTWIKPFAVSVETHPDYISCQEPLNLWLNISRERLENSYFQASETRSSHYIFPWRTQGIDELSVENTTVQDSYLWATNSSFIYLFLGFLALISVYGLSKRSRASGSA